MLSAGLRLDRGVQGRGAFPRASGRIESQRHGLGLYLGTDTGGGVSGNQFASRIRKIGRHAAHVLSPRYRACRDSSAFLLG